MGRIKILNQPTFDLEDLWLGERTITPADWQATTEYGYNFYYPITADVDLLAEPNVVFTPESARKLGCVGCDTTTNTVRVFTVVKPTTNIQIDHIKVVRRYK